MSASAVLLRAATPADGGKAALPTCPYKTGFGEGAGVNATAPAGEELHGLKWGFAPAPSTQKLRILPVEFALPLPTKSRGFMAPAVFLGQGGGLSFSLLAN